MTPMEIAQLVSIIVSGVVSIAVLFGVGVYFAERARHKAGRKNKKEIAAEEAAERQQKEAEALKQQQYENALRLIIREENAPLKADVADIKSNLSHNTVGTVTLLRDRMKAILDECRDKGWASPSTKANWHELYKTYGELGGNHFKEYVDQWREALDALPIEPKKTTSTKTKGLPKGVRMPYYHQSTLMPEAQGPQIVKVAKKATDGK